MRSLRDILCRAISEHFVAFADALDYMYSNVLRRKSQCFTFLYVNICIVPYTESDLSLRSSGIARVNEGSRITDLPATHSCIDRWNEPYLSLLPAAERHRTLAGTRFPSR